MEAYVHFEDVCKYYKTGETVIAAADHVNFDIKKGEFCVIVGP
jgi:putative ABC transport system ATP-binding protein